MTDLGAIPVNVAGVEDAAGAEGVRGGWREGNKCIEGTEGAAVDAGGRDGCV